MGEPHRLNMELDLQSLFGLHVQFVHRCTYWLRPPATSPPCIWAQIRGRYWSAKIDDIFLWPPGEPKLCKQCVSG
jgi:hypothetical protein